jgi:multimeric flavodoxin WrbA
MKINIINGSTRKRGSTARILHEIERVLLEKHDVEVTYINLSQYDMKPCKGCIHCYKTGQCILTDDGIEMLVEQIKRSDGLIIGSPTYGSNVPGHLKNFMDRGHFLIDQSLHNKYGFIVTTYEIADGNVVQKILQKFLTVSGAIVRGKYVLKLDFDTDPWAQKGASSRLHRQIEKFYRAINIRKRRHYLSDYSATSLYKSFGSLYFSVSLTSTKPHWNRGIKKASELPEKHPSYLIL